MAKAKSEAAKAAASKVAMEKAATAAAKRKKLLEEKAAQEKAAQEKAIEEAKVQGPKTAARPSPPRSVSRSEGQSKDTTAEVSSLSHEEERRKAKREKLEQQVYAVRAVVHASAVHAAV